MTVKVTKPALNLREELSSLKKETGVAGEAMLRAATPQEQFNLIGAGRKNLLINGAMQVWQRGTSASFSGNVAYHTVDRFMIWLGNGSGSISKQTDVIDGESFNYLRVVNDGNGTNPNAVFLRQRLEDLAFLGGKTTTLSFRARASSAMSINFYQRHSYGSGGSATEDIEGTESVTLGTSWQEYTVTLPTWHTRTGKTFGDNAFAMVGFQADTTSAWTVDITNVQLELGSVATPFEHRSYGEELALCQRYYQVINKSHLMSSGYASSSGNTLCCVLQRQFPVVMRASPSHNLTSIVFNTLATASTLNGLVSVNVDGFSASPTSTGAGRTYIYLADRDATFDAEL